MSPIVLALFFAAVVGLPVAVAADPSQDPRLWLEEVAGKRAIEWVERENRACTTELTRSPEFAALKSRFLGILNADTRIPYVSKLGDRYYNFWRDARHTRGVWRRTNFEEYRKDAPAWEVVLDLDSLAAAEKENWVWGGSSPLPPDYNVCLLKLSRGGGDAKVWREFDLVAKRFVEGGFTLPESKSELGWIDRDRVYVGLAFDSTTTTASGYPRVAKEWKRGTPLSSATMVYEGRTQDVSVDAAHHFRPGFEYDFVERWISWSKSDLFLRRGRALIRVEKPADAEASMFREWLLLRLLSDWTVAGKSYPAGALLAARFEDFLAGKREFEVLFQPSERRSLLYFSPARSAIYVNELENVKSRVYALHHENGIWSRVEIPSVPELETVTAYSVDYLESDDYWLSATGFLTPSNTSRGSLGGGKADLLKQSPAFFDASGLAVSQHEAVSKDGTRIPYFQVAPVGPKADGSAPTLLTGYGGFEASMVPYYNSLQGSGWLERGGVFVLANIRGGGEFGPGWHTAAIKENRPRAYEDFIAVAEDLVRRKVTSARHLACSGGSNGGLLVGNMLTMRPDLFGAIVCGSPLLDMERYTKLLAGPSWMDEYGNPDDPNDWAYIRTFSPYHNVKKGVRYPPTLFTSSGRDDRVHPGHARKMVAKLRADHQNVLYYENVEGGHAGAANSEQAAFLSAMTQVFLWKHVGR